MAATAYRREREAMEGLRRLASPDPPPPITVVCLPARLLLLLAWSLLREDAARWRRLPRLLTRSDAETPASPIVE